MDIYSTAISNFAKYGWIDTRIDAISSDLIHN